MNGKPTYKELEQRVRDLELEVARKDTPAIESDKSVYRSITYITLPPKMLIDLAVTRRIRFSPDG